MSYNPITGLVYIPTYDDVAHPNGYLNESIGRLIAWDPVTETARWSVPEPLPTNSGVLSTAGNLVFAKVRAPASSMPTRPITATSSGRYQDALGDRCGAGQLHGRRRSVHPVAGRARLALEELRPHQHHGHPGVQARPVAPLRLQARRTDGLSPLRTSWYRRCRARPMRPRTRSRFMQGEEVFTQFNCNDCHSPGCRRQRGPGVSMGRYRTCAICRRTCTISSSPS